MDYTKLLGSLGRDLSNATRIAASATERRAMGRGLSAMASLGGDLFNEKLATSAQGVFRQAWRSGGRYGMMRGAMIGAGAGAAYQMGSNAYNGNGLFSGVMGAGLRGGFYGGAIGGIGGMSRHIGAFQRQGAATPYGPSYKSRMNPLLQAHRRLRRTMR